MKFEIQRMQSYCRQIVLPFTISMVFGIINLSAASTAKAQVSDLERWNHMRTVKQEQYICYRTTGSIDIDGKLDDASWKNAPWTNYFVDIEGDRKPLPYYKTRVKMLWDDYYFYFAVDMEEPHVWTTILFHDQSVCVENDFEIFIDPNSDNHEYFELEINPLNTMWELFLRQPYKDGGGGELSSDHSWDPPGLKTAVHVDGTINDPRDIDKGWSCEFAVPWSDLAAYAHRACPPRDGDSWRVNFSRVEYQHEIVTAGHTEQKKNNAYRKKETIPCENWVWSPHGVINMHTPEMFGNVQFSTAPMGKAEFKPDPTAPARLILHDIYYAQRDFKKENDRWADKIDELGLDYTGNKLLLQKPIIERTDDGYLAAVSFRLPDGKSKTLRIRQDSLILE